MKIKVNGKRKGIPNKQLFNQIKNCKSKVFKPKKGKGSFKRDKRIDLNDSFFFVNFLKNIYYINEE